MAYNHFDNTLPDDSDIGTDAFDAIRKNFKALQDAMAIRSMPFWSFDITRDETGRVQQVTYSEHDPNDPYGAPLQQIQATIYWESVETKPNYGMPKAVQYLKLGTVNESIGDFYLSYTGRLPTGGAWEFPAGGGGGGA